MFKKGQAAMEFLMTYGWAILAAIIAIGVLAYFGVFSPGKLVGSTGVVNPPFAIDEFNIINDGGGAGQDRISLAIGQNLGESVTLELQDGTADGVEVVLTDGTTCVEAENAGEADVISAAAPVAWASGNQVTINVDCGAKWIKGDLVRADITIRYKKTSGGTLVQQSTGTLRGSSQ
ncbi:MAG: hypothetical protein Q7S27_03665 [Nanoarchaeota archaeon]|nr:hypothetical protein [Nanoarchaeota archaeon]